MNNHVTTKHGDRCLVLKPGRGVKPARVKRLRDGSEFDVYYEDLATATGGAYAFYGVETIDRGINSRNGKTLKDEREKLYRRTVREFRRDPKTGELVEVPLSPLGRAGWRK